MYEYLMLYLENLIKEIALLAHELLTLIMMVHFVMVILNLEPTMAQIIWSSFVYLQDCSGSSIVLKNHLSLIWVVSTLAQLKISQFTQQNFIMKSSDDHLEQLEKLFRIWVLICSIFSQSSVLQISH